MRRGHEGRIQKGLVCGQGGKSTEKITSKKARGRASSSLWKVALQRLEEQSSSVPFSTYASILRGCCVAHCLPLGRRAHAILIARGLEQDHYLGNLLLLIYCTCDALPDSFTVFHRALPARNVFSWAIIIKACIHHGHFDMAMQLFSQMHVEGIMPDAASFVAILSACAQMKALPQAMHLHVSFLCGGLERNHILETTLLNTYSTCGSLERARQTFDDMHIKNVVSWTAMIAAYSHHGYGRDALFLFQEMQVSGVIPNEVTYLSLVDACACDESLVDGKLMHVYIVERVLHVDAILENALISMYSACSSLDDASAVFDKVIERDVVSWTSIITACVHHGCCQNAHRHFEQMQVEGIFPDRVTFISMLDVCAIDATLMEGKKIHLHVEFLALDLDVVLGTALINMYGKCGKPCLADRILNDMQVRNLLTWNTIVATHAQHGDVEKALHFFNRMELAGVRPDIATFSSILSACAHAGLVEDGFKCALKMHQDYGIQPTVEHSNCIVGLLGRLGLVKDGEGLMSSMPMQPSGSSWDALLGACKTHLYLLQGKHAAQHAFELSPEKESSYVVLSNLCTVVTGTAGVPL